MATAFQADAFQAVLLAFQIDAAPAAPPARAPAPAPPAEALAFDVDHDTLCAVQALWASADVDEFED